MKTYNKLTSLLIVLILPGLGCAQSVNEQNHPSPPSPIHKEKQLEHNPKGYRGENSSFTPEQTAKVAKILSQYSPTSLTASDARAINNAFREAGIRRGPGQSQAVKAAGFDPQKIRDLDPPPEKKH